MRSIGDDRGQSVQVGAVLLFGILIVFLAIWQAQVVPIESKQVEFQHSEQVQSDLTELRNTLVSSRSSGTTSQTIALGLRYPSRILFVSPPPSSGTLRTVGSGEYNVTIENAVAEPDEGAIAEMWDGSLREYNTTFIEYDPSYTRYDDPPTTVYEHSLLYNDFENGRVSITDQRIVDGDRLTLLTVQGDYERSAAWTESVDLTMTSASDNRISVTGDGDEPIVLTFPTRQPEMWNESLSDELEANGQRGNVLGISVEKRSEAPDLVTVELNGTQSYELRMANARLGSGSDTQEAAYVTAVSGDDASIPRGNSVTLVGEVRDRFNNPVNGKRVTADPTEGAVEPTSRTSDSDGRVRFRYTAPVSAGEDTITFQTTDAISETFRVNVLEEGGAPQLDPLLFSQADWNNAVEEQRVVHDGVDVPWRHQADRIELGYPRDGRWDENPVGYWPLDERIGTRTYNLAPATPTDDGRVREAGEISNVRSQGIVVPQLTNRNRGAYDFEGTNGFVDIDASSLDTGNTVTVSAWVNPKTQSTYSVFWADNGVELSVESGEPQFSVAGNSVGNGSVGSDEWTHIAGVYDPDGSGDIRLYVNGELEATDSTDGSSIDSPTGIQLGGGDAGRQTIPGQISEVRVYDEALNTSQVDNLARVVSDGYLLTDWQTADTTVDLETVELVDVDARFPNENTAIAVTVEAEDTFGAVQTSDTIEINESSEYEIRGLDGPANRFRLLIELETTDPQSTASFLAGRVDGQEANQTGNVTGQVLFNDPIDGQQPLADATVTIGDEVAQTTTDENGEYTFSDLFIGNYTIDAEKDGFSPGNITVEAVENQTTIADDLVLEPELGTVEGRVVDRDDETEAIADATVSSEELDRSTTTNATGYYRLEDVLAVRQDFTASSTDYSESRKIVTVIQDDTVELNFELTSTVRQINGTASDSSDGSALEDVTVTIEETGQQRITDGTGSYSFDNAPQENLTITAEKDGYLNENRSTQTETDDETIDFDLQPNVGTITGTVQDAEYSTFSLKSDTDIIATRESDGEEFSVTVPVDPDSGNEPYDYEIELEPGEYTLRAEADGYEINEFEEVIEVQATETATGPDFEMEALPGSISGRVVDSVNADPISGASVDGNNTITGVEYSATSDNDGDYLFDPIDRGTYSFEATANGFDPDTREIDIGPGEELTSRNFVLDPPANALIARGGDVGPSKDDIDVTATLENIDNEEAIFDILLSASGQAQNINDREVTVQYQGNTETLELTDDAWLNATGSGQTNLLDPDSYQSGNTTIVEDVRDDHMAKGGVTLDVQINSGDIIIETDRV